MAMITRNVKFQRKPVPGPQGPTGPRGKRMRGPQDWDGLVDGYQFYPLDDASSEVFDVVEYQGQYYECAKKHTKASGTTPLSNYQAQGGLWTLATQYSFVATKVLWSKIAQIDFLGSQVINVRSESSDAHISLHDGMMEVFGSKNSVMPNIRFGVDPNTGCSILSYYDNDGNWLYDLGPNGLDNKNITQGRLESYDFLPAHTYLNSIKSSGLTASSALYTATNFTVGSETMTKNVAVQKVDSLLFPRLYADDATELKNHNITGYDPGENIASWGKLYKYTAARLNNEILADSTNGLSKLLAKEADGKWFTSTSLSNGTKLINLASGNYIRKGSKVRQGISPMSDTGSNKVPAYDFPMAVIDSNNKMQSVSLSSRILRTVSSSL